MEASVRGPSWSSTGAGRWRIRSSPDDAKAGVLDTMFADASPSPRSMRAGPEYRLAMLRVLGLRGVHTAIERLARR